MRADPVMLQRAKRLLRENRPQRDIARQTGLDRGTIRRLKAELDSEAKPAARP